MLAYQPEINKIYNYTAELEIRQELEKLNSKKPSPAVPVSNDFYASAAFDLEISTRNSHYVEKYTLKSATITMDTGGILVPVRVLGDLSSETAKLIGKEWEVPVSSTGAIIGMGSELSYPYTLIPSREQAGTSGYRRFFPHMSERTMQTGEEFTTKSNVRYPLLDMILNVNTSIKYTLKNILKNGLCSFLFSAEVTSASHYPKWKQIMPESEISGLGTGTFLYNAEKCLVESFAADFSFKSDVFSRSPSSGEQKLKIKQTLKVSVLRR